MTHEPAIDELVEKIKDAFSIPFPEKLSVDLFWEFSHVHCDATEFPHYLGKNMLVILNWLNAKVEFPAALKQKMSLLLLNLDICRDEVLRDPSIENDLKKDYVMNEMRLSHKERLLHSYFICSELSPAQIECVLEWLTILSGLEEFQYELPDGIVECWSTFSQNGLPDFSDLS